MAGFFLANEYCRAMGIPGLADKGKVGDVYKELAALGDRFVGVATSAVNVDDLASTISGTKKE